MTLRQFAVWDAWVAEDFNNPSRTDYYLMGIAANVIRPHLTEGARVTLDDFRIKFGKQAEENKMPTQKEIEANKARWFEAVGGNVRRPDGTMVTPPKKESSEQRERNIAREQRRARGKK